MTHGHPNPAIIDTEQGTITPPSAWIYRAARDWRSLLVMVPLMALMIGV